VALPPPSPPPLKNVGRNAAEKWLRQNWGSIGKRSTVDIREEFL
jgi:hypothetical protein